MASAQVEIEVDLPEGVSIRGYERHQGAHVFEVDFDLPEHCTCSHCGQRAEVNLRLKNDVLVIRDLDLFGQPSFWAYQVPLHQCPDPRCRQRTQLPTPFKRPHVSYTFRFEQYVMESLVGSSVEDVARRLSISAETVENILEQQLASQRAIPAEAQITSLGFDELSLKKRHKLYVTVMSDLSDDKHPRVLAVVKGRDKEATEKCLAMLTPQQREAVRSHRTDMSAVYAEVGSAWLPNSQVVIDRFHVAKQLGQVVDGVRKKRVASS
jgi:transposase